MNLLAIDPGEKACGFAIVRLEGPRTRWLGGGKIDATRAGFQNLLNGALLTRCLGADVVALEDVSGFIHEPFRGPHLLATAKVLGGIAWECEREGLRVVELTARAWRKTLCGKANASDGVIADAVRANVVDMPTSSNEHVRDALGLAIVAGWVARGQAGRSVAS